MLDSTGQPPVRNIHRNRVVIQQLNEFGVLISRRGTGLDRAEVDHRLNLVRRSKGAAIELRHDDHVAAADAVVKALDREDVPSGT